MKEVKIKFRTNFNTTPDDFPGEKVDPVSMTEPDMTLDVKELYARMMSGQYIPDGAALDNGAQYDGDNSQAVESLDTRLREAVDMAEAHNIAVEMAQAATPKESVQGSPADKPPGAVAPEPVNQPASQSAGNAAGVKSAEDGA